MIPKKIIFTARDPGAAYQLAEIIDFFSKEQKFEVKVLAADPAFQIFKSKGIQVYHIDSNSLPNGCPLDGSSLHQEVKKYLESESPDVVFVGLSSPDCGIDEAIIALVGSRVKTYAFQDFWGDINIGFGVTPNTYFVLDELAGKLTQKRVSKRTVIAGSPRHIHYRNINFNHNSDCENYILFAGQPLWHLNGYKKSIGKVLDSLYKTDRNIKFLYRPHPKETTDQIDSLLKFAEGYSVDFKIDRIASVEQSLLKANLLISCYSSCGFDLVQLNRESPFPLAGIIFLMIESDIKEFYSNYTKLHSIPLSEMELSLTIDNNKYLSPLIEKGLSTNWKTSSWLEAKNIVTSSVTALEIIHRTILEDLFPSEEIRKNSE